MPLGRGERIGEAYVRILMDGEGLGDSFADELEGHEGDIQTAGERGASAYVRGWDKQIRHDDDELTRSVEDSLNIGAGRMDAIADQVSRLYHSRLRENLGKHFNNSDIGDRIFEKIVGRFSRTGSFSGLERDLEHLRELSIEVTNDILNEEEKLARKRKQDAREYAQLQKAQGREFLENLRNMQDHYTEIVKGQQASRKELREARQNLMALNIEAERFGDLMGKGRRAEVDRTLEEMRRGLIRSTPLL